MGFDVTATAYDRFMGRYSTQLAPSFRDFIGVRAGWKALDVGSGPGALTAELVRRLGPRSVAAVDPSEPFVTTARARFPGVDVRSSFADDLPFPDDAFDATAAQLVVHFMRDPIAGIVEMARVTRPDGVVAACVWDFAGDRAPISAFWRAARELDSGVEDESGQFMRIRSGTTGAPGDRTSGRRPGRAATASGSDSGASGPPRPARRCVAPPG